MKTVRKIIRIEEEKCNGCGFCIPKCPEGALQIINGVAKLTNEVYCDGLGACIGTCPQGAIIIEEREAEEFDEKAVKQRLKEREVKGHAHEDPSMRLEVDPEANNQAGHTRSVLNHWPVQLALVHPKAPFFENKELLVVADCVPFAYANFHQVFLKGRSIVVGCPKLDDPQSHEKKLTELFRESNIKSVTVINMEVPCCYGLQFLVERALRNSGMNIPLRQVIIGTAGERKE